MDYKKNSLRLIHKNWNRIITERKSSFFWLQRMKKKLNKKVCIFCAGKSGIEFYSYLKGKGISADCFIDNDIRKHGTIITDGKECISWTELTKKKEEYIVIVASVYIAQVWQQLKKGKIPYILNSYDIDYWKTYGVQIRTKKNVLHQVAELFDSLADQESKRIVYSKLKSFLDYENRFGCKNTFENIFTDAKLQYRPLDISLNFLQGAFVDCGAYTGDTLDMLKSFVDWEQNTYICYELDKQNYSRLNQYIDKLDPIYRDKIFAYNYGVGKEKKKIYYAINGTESRITEGAQTSVSGQLISISEHLKNEKVGYIKMDIEGSEMDALIGAHELIQKQKPVLGICLYHKFADLWEIPLYLKRLVPEYKIYIRHYTDIHLETVCYATL